MCAVEIKIKWIKRKQMTHENTYRHDMSMWQVIVTMLWQHQLTCTCAGPLLEVRYMYDVSCCYHKSAWIYGHEHVE
jgi:hypothetical protein